MPTWHRVTCVSRSAGAGAGERITHLGGDNAHGKPWRVSVREAIDGIIAGKWGFFVVVDQQRQDLILATDAAGERFVKTRLDADEAATLLALPQCA